MDMEQTGRRPGRDQVRAGDGVGKGAERRVSSRFWRDT